MSDIISIKNPFDEIAEGAYCPFRTQTVTYERLGKTYVDTEMMPCNKGCMAFCVNSNTKQYSCLRLIDIKTNTNSYMLFRVKEDEGM